VHGRGDSLSTPRLVVLHNDWRGQYDLGSYNAGALNKPCRMITRSSNFQTVTPDGQLDTNPKHSVLNTNWYHCLEVEWPAPHVWVTRETRNRSINGPNAWMGTLIDGMRDNSGHMYMRNRYYDPATGRFTQEDPIGLAGGLNAYGFANGDPVSYTDPYGLCPVWFDRKPCTLGFSGITASVQSKIVTGTVSIGIYSSTESTGFYYSYGGGVANPATKGVSFTVGSEGGEAESEQQFAGPTLVASVAGGRVLGGGLSQGQNSSGGNYSYNWGVVKGLSAGTAVTYTKLFGRTPLPPREIRPEAAPDGANWVRHPSPPH
jgi:RHS repeat-associated protein